MAVMGIRPGPPRRRPYPYDININGRGYMLGHADQQNGQGVGDLVAEKPQDLSQVVPSDYKYSAQSPLLEAVQAYGDLSLGYGQKQQQSLEDRRYKGAVNVDCSVNGLWMKGPQVSTLLPGTVDATATQARIVEYASDVYVVAGRYAQHRDSDVAVSVSKDFGPGKAATDAVVFYSNAAGGAQYLWVAMGDTEPVWRLGPTFEIQTLTVSGTPTGGTWRVQWNGYTTDLLVYNAAAAAVQTALQALPGLGAVTVTTSGTSPNVVHTVTFVGVTTDPPQMTIVNNLTGGASPTVTPATATAFVAAAWEQRTEVQTITITGTPTGGSYTLQYGTATTAAIAFNADGPTVQAALRLLAGLGSVTVTTTGTTPNYTHAVKFDGVSGPAIPLVAANSLTGGSSPAITQARTEKILTARAWALGTREFWRSPSANNVAKCDPDADPWREANWEAPNAFTIGDKSQSITRMGTTIASTLVVFKPDGVYTIDGAGEDHNILPNLRTAVDSTNGEAYGTWLDDMFVGYGQGVYRIDPTLAATEIGSDRLVGNDTDVQGQLTACYGHQTFSLYGAIWNPDSNTSYVLKFGAWTTLRNYALNANDIARQDVWHGAISVAYAGKKILCMQAAAAGAPTSHKRLYLYFSDGTVGWFVLPCRPNPAACSSYRFSTTDGTLDMPTWTGMFFADPKGLRAYTLTSLNFSSTAYGQVQYRSDPNAAYQPMPSDFNTGQRQKVEFPVGTAGIVLDTRVVLKSTATTTTPLLTGLGLHFQLRTTLYQVLDLQVLAAPGLTNRKGVPLRMGATTIRDQLEGYANMVGTVTLTTPDEKVREVTVKGYGQKMAWNERMRRWQAAIHLQCTEAVTATVYGTYGRMEAFTYDQLSRDSYGQIEAV